MHKNASSSLFRPIKYQGYLPMNSDDISAAFNMVQLWVDIATPSVDVGGAYAWPEINETGESVYLELGETFRPTMTQEYADRMAFWEDNWTGYP